MLEKFLVVFILILNLILSRFYAQWLDEEVKVSRCHGKVAFDDWKQLNFPLEGDAYDIYRAKRKDYRPKL